MNEAIRAMLRTYGPIKTKRDEENTLQEILQQITLHGLYLGGFFDTAAFYGGTALRMLYGLDRFSEDLDFCLKNPDKNFDLQTYLSAIQEELERYGFTAFIEEKRSGQDVAIEPAFVKQETISGLMIIGRDGSSAQKGQRVKIRLEVDKTNPKGANYCTKLIKLPTPYMIGTMTEGSLFAGKLHALIARAYLNRVKGRDYYDFLYYVARGTPVNFGYLEAKLVDSGHIQKNQHFGRDDLIELLQQKFRDVDFKKAREDVIPFVKPERQKDLKSWSTQLFSALALDIKTE